MHLEVVILLTVISTCPALCPTKCTCTLDQKNRKTVLCKDGGIVGPLTLQNVSQDTQILKITAPDDNSNMLTMSPVFRDFKRLEEIHITKSNMPQLGMHFFYGLTRLDVLNLSQNNITQPLDHNFRGLDKLKQLLLDDNRIQSLPSGTFRFLHGLKVLSIQRNRITELANRIFLEIGNLTVLKLSGNDLRQLNPEVFSDIQKLRRLDCRGCHLRKLHKEIYHFLPHLTYLDLGDNDIMNLHTDDLKDLTNLEHLKLDGNQLLILHDNTFVNQIYLRELDVSRNALTKIGTDAFVELYNLTELNLGWNKLGKIHEGAFNFIVGTLEKLILSGNHLKLHTLKELSCLKFLRELKLSRCGLLETDPEMFPPNLEQLDLSENLITVVNAQHLPLNLEQLDISKNKIRGISEGNLIRLDSLSYLNLADNPWSCDLCYIVPLLERANRSHTFSQVMCSSPFTMRNKTLGMLEKSQLTWCTAASYSTGDADYFLISHDGKIGIIAASMSVCLLFLTMVAVIGAVCYSRRHAAKYYTHEDKLDIEGDNMFQNHSPLFCDGELSFKFPLEVEKKVSIATIEEMSNGQLMLNGT